VALNRPSYVVSTFTDVHGHNPPENGNDGDKSHCDRFENPHSVAMSKVALHPWYGVDLGVPLKVAGVKLTNRAAPYSGE